MSLRYRCSAVLVLASLVVLGCGGPNPSAASSVSGRVTFKGQPLTGGLIGFIGKSGQGSAQSLIAEDGTYSIKEMPAGEFDVMVTTVLLKDTKPPPYSGGNKLSGPMYGGKGYGPNMPPPPQITQQQSGGKGISTNSTPAEASSSRPPGTYVEIPSKYTDPKKSGLSATLAVGANSDVNFPLTADAGK